MSYPLKRCRRGLHVIENRYYDQTEEGECRQCRNAKVRGERLPPLDKSRCWAGLHDLTQPGARDSEGKCRACRLQRRRWRHKHANLSGRRIA